ncbi:MAG TPA: hypothetical protein VMR23_01715 [Candidatus Limnocylindria bacterium]|nr:hypothetical protein [Candidatus Limnocylindria bacterium]
MLTQARTCQEREGRRAAIDVGLVVSPAERDACFRLVHAQYVERGYTERDPSGRRLLLHQALPATRMFRATSAARVVATVSLVPDSVLGLPMDDLYAAELRPLRTAGRRLAEVSALAAAPGAGSATVAGLLSRLVLYAERLGRVDDLCVTVHPRHARFYERLGFSPLGPVRQYEAVNGAPAVALRLDLRLALATAGERRAAARRFLAGEDGDRALARLREEQPRSGLTAREFLRFFAGQPVLERAAAARRAVVQTFYSDVRPGAFPGSAAPNAETTVLVSA